MPLIVGVSGSLRAARHGAGNRELVSDLGRLATRADLRAYIAEQSRNIVDDFFAAGRDKNLPFDEIYRQFKRLSGRRGLSNAEAAVAAALWGAKEEGADIDHASLSSHFLPSGSIREPGRLRDMLLAADGLLLSTPVYFGDRGSLIQSLLEFIAADPELCARLAGKVYAGLAVGAKRNGGQETTLIFQLLDMINLGFLGVGDSSDTTSQYGGTLVGGDVGSVQSDDYGLDTAVSTGRRAARVAHLLSSGAGAPELLDKLRVAVWVLQHDREGSGVRQFERWAADVERTHPNVSVRLFDVPRHEVVRCIACDICPTRVGPHEEYRCIITQENDFFVRHHAALIDTDAVLVGAYSPEDRSTVVSAYQQFIERTRYLRRDNYVFTDYLTAPFVFSELEARQNFHIRMLTSMVRHHTVVHHPLLGMVRCGEVLNAGALDRQTGRFLQNARILLQGRLLRSGTGDTFYKPVGYKISALKSREDHEKGLHEAQNTQHRADLARQRERRLSDGPAERL